MTVTTEFSRLPCVGHHDLYDAALHSSATDNRERVRSARLEAARLCGSCPRPCAEKVTPPSPARRPAPSTPVLPAPADADDADAVRLVLVGHLPPRALTAAEKRYLVRVLHAQGLVDRQIAARLGSSITAVWTLRTALGLAAHKHLD